jgi:flavin reductase (DIM6/NTAB) family NADH-FMN oxidoreductase RutF
MQFDFTKLDSSLRYKLLGSTVTPRPIAWVSTLDAQGRLNAAPFSFFNAFGEDPPILAFAILHRSATDLKDTGANIRLQREFVVNLVSDDNLDQMNVSAIDFPPEIDEFVEARITPAPSVSIRTPRIAQSHVSFECRLNQIVELGPKRSLVLGEVLTMHIDDAAVIDAERGYIDTPSLRLVGRMHANSYVRTADILRLPSIPVSEWISRALEAKPVE